jgi:hypothetical protein
MFSPFASIDHYLLLSGLDMPAEMRDEAMDICIIAVEKYQKEMEKCTQVRNSVLITQTVTRPHSILCELRHIFHDGHLAMIR